MNLEATLFEGGETSGFGDHTKTVGTPVNNAIVSVQVTSPDSQVVVGRLHHPQLKMVLILFPLRRRWIGNYDIE